MMQANLEHHLTEIWKTVLGFHKVPPNLDFYEAGGNSMQAMRIISLIEEKFKVSLSMSDFFEATTISKLSAELCHRGVVVQ